MAIVISSADFTGKFKLTVNEFTISDLDSYIERYTVKFLIELFGKELYDLWSVDETMPPYDALTNPFAFQSSCSKVYESKGVKDMLMGAVYFHYTRDIIQKQSIDGMKRTVAENSTGISFAEGSLHTRWNEAIDTYEAIQAYILDNNVTYPEFNGIKQQVIIPFF